MYLAAIMPPSNIRRVIYDYQLSLFRRTAHPAALALPPHLPIAFFESAPASPGSRVQLHPFESAGLFLDPPWQLLEFGPVDEIQRLRAFLPESDATGWYPTGRGVPLSAAITVGSKPPQEEAPRLRWKTSHMVCMELNADDQIHWWQHVEYSVIWRVKLKRRID